MGADKGLIDFCGQPLIAHMLKILREAGLAGSIAGARADSRANMSSFAPLVDDLDSSRGPLAGICSALTVTSLTWAVFVPIDLPLLPLELIRVLLDHARLTGRAVTLASLNGFIQTFPCVLNRAILPALRSELGNGRGGCFSAFQAVARGSGQSLAAIPAELLAQTGQVRHPDGLPPARWLFNINSPSDLDRAGAFRPGLTSDPNPSRGPSTSCRHIA